jgi:general nucleoside transport system permease protein
LSVPFVQGVATGAVLTAATVYYGAIGEVVVERAGMVNLGLEGTMVTGACFGFVAAFKTGNAYVGLLAAMLAGALFNMLFGWLVVTRRANMLASGLTLMFFGYGLTALVGRDYVGKPGTGLDHWNIPGLSDIPWVGSVFFSGNLLTFAAVPAALLIWWLLYRTRWGLDLRTVGESRTAAFAAGLSPDYVQYQALFVGGMLGGLGGAYLSIGNTPVWVEFLTNGVGFIAVALVIFSSWNAIRALIGALIFGGSVALNTTMQAHGGIHVLGQSIQINTWLLDMLPYLLTLGVLLIWGRKRQYQMPMGLAEVFEGTM